MWSRELFSSTIRFTTAAMLLGEREMEYSCTIQALQKPFGSSGIWASSLIRPLRMHRQDSQRLLEEVTPRRLKQPLLVVRVLQLLRFPRVVLLSRLRRQQLGLCRHLSAQQPCQAQLDSLALAPTLEGLVFLVLTDTLMVMVMAILMVRVIDVPVARDLEALDPGPDADADLDLSTEEEQGQGQGLVEMKAADTAVDEVGETRDEAGAAEEQVEVEEEQVEVEQEAEAGRLGGHNQLPSPPPPPGVARPRGFCSFPQTLPLKLR